MPLNRETSPAVSLLAGVETCLDAVMLTDREGRIRYVNPAWEKLYGYRSTQVVGETGRFLRTRHYQDAFFAEIWERLLAPAPHGGWWQGELIHRAQDGRELTVLLRISPADDGGFLCLATDLTSKKSSEAQGLLSDRQSSLGFLAAGLSHQLGTPLGVVRGRAELLMRDVSENSAPHRHLEVIVEQADRIAHLLNELFTLTRQTQSTDAVPTSLRAAILGALGRLAPTLAQLPAIALEVAVDAEACVLAEPTRLQQVFRHVIQNALQAIEIAVAAGRRENHRLSIRAVRQASQWEVEIVDTGDGITGEAHKHLFKPFFTTKDVGKGAGLGLALSLQLIQAWGGKITAETADGATVFRIFLPAATL